MFYESNYIVIIQYRVIAEERCIPLTDSSGFEHLTNLKEEHISVLKDFM